MAYHSLPEKAFRDRFTSWVRLEPRARDDDFTRGLEARTADPLWMLGRQWQFGEYDGEDTGSAIAVSVSYRTTDVTHIARPDGSASSGQKRAAGPLVDIAIEAMPFAWDWRRRVQVGQRLEMLMRDLGGAQALETIIKLRAVCGVPTTGDPNELLDEATKRYLSLVAGRVVDGKRVSDQVIWNSRPTPPSSWSLSNDEAMWVTRALLALKQWMDEVYPAWAGRSAWHSEKLRHEFALLASGNLDARLVTRDHQGGPIDWYDVSLARGVAVTVPSEPKIVRAVPTRVAFASAPHPRWWAFEDAHVQLGRMEVNTTDVSTLALLEFAVVYANDWLSVPFAAQAGRIVEVVSVLVTDVFGRDFKLSPSENLVGAGIRRWQMYATSTDAQPLAAGASKTLFVPPVSSDALELPAEEVVFVRDEGANMVFAIEHRVRNARGDTVPGIEAQRERGFSGEVTDEGGNALRFRLATPVPGNWFPFVPVARDAAKREVLLRRALLLRNSNDEEPVPIPPLGAFLRENGVWLEEASVLRSGVKVQLVRRRARSVDGRTHVWMARQVTVGKGEGRSGLQFDVIREPKS